MENTEPARKPENLKDLATSAGKFAVHMQNQLIEGVKASSAAIAAFTKLIEGVAGMDTPGGKHVVCVENGRWTVHHPLTCRQPSWKTLAACTVPWAVSAAERLPEGWHLVEVTDDGTLMHVPYDEVDEDPAVDMAAETAGYHPNTGERDDPLTALFPGLPAYAERVIAPTGELAGWVWPNEYQEGRYQAVLAADKPTDLVGHVQYTFRTRDDAARWVKEKDQEARQVDPALRAKYQEIPPDAERVFDHRSDVVGWVWPATSPIDPEMYWCALHTNRPRHIETVAKQGPLTPRQLAIGWVLEEEKKFQAVADHEARSDRD